MNKNVIARIDLEGEVWKDVVGYEGLYQVSNLGRVYSVMRIINGIHYGGRMVRQFQRDKKDKFYLHVQLWNKGKPKCMLVHRLVAMAFLPNPNNYPCVNHKDEDKQNNKADNLEWCDASMNGKHKFQIGLQRPKKGFDNVLSKAVAMYSLNGDLLHIFGSLSDAVLFLNRPHSSYHCIARCCNGERKTALKHKWEWLNRQTDRQRTDVE